MSVDIKKGCIMKKQLTILAFGIVLSSCSKIYETMDTLEYNRQAIERSTEVINENAKAIQEANESIAENQRQLEKINKSLQKATES
jgi:methyl-accepting chemotaxis protein